MKKKILGRLLTMLLVAAMVFTLLPASAIAAAEWWGGDEYVDDTATQATTTDDFIRVFHLDCGRKYFSVAQIKAIIDQLAANHYTHLELAIGNDALRFLLDNMSLTVNDKEYTSKQVSDAIHSGNINYYNEGQTNELTETDMNDIIAYAKTNGIEIIPLLNSPGHMDAILSAATSLTGTNCAYSNSARTIDVTNDTAVAFAQALIQKYIDYFADNCKYFNIGADEYANDRTNGFSDLISSNKYGSFVSYVNSIADAITSAGMTPMAFNDGIYYASKTGFGTFRTSIVVCYWTSGWTGYTPAAATFLTERGHKILNTNDAWYYVLGRAAGNSSGYTIATATNGAQNTAYNNVSKQSYQSNPSDEDIIGCMQCLWCDAPSASYSTSEVSNVNTLISTFSKANSTVFVEPATPGITITPSDGTASGSTKLDSANGNTSSVTLSASEVVTWTWDHDLVNLMSADTDVNTYAEPESISAKSVIVTPVAGASGDAVITVTGDSGKTANYTIAVYDSSAPEIADTIPVTVGGTATRTFTGDVRDTLKKDNFDESIATVSAKHKQEAGGTEIVIGNQLTPQKNKTVQGVITTSDKKNYLVVDANGKISNTTDINKATQFTVERNDSYGAATYTIKTTDDNYYLSVGNYYGTVYTLNTTRSNRSWKYNNGYGFYNTNANQRYLIFDGDSWTVSQYGDSYGLLYGTTTKPTNPVDETTVTFTGVSAGTTYVTIDGKLYKIVVTPENLDNVTPLTVEYWSTNRHVYAIGGSDTTQYNSVSITASEAYGEAGILLSSKAIATGVNTETGESNMVFWKCTRLTSDNKQTTGAGVDKTTSGDDFVYIRYLNGNWSFSADRVTWTNFNVSSYSATVTDQVVAYYMQKTDVTDEITTNVTDWGPFQSDYTSDAGKYVLLDFAVKYESGTRVPDTFPNAKKTIGFHCQSNDLRVGVDSDGNYYRMIGRINTVATEEYEVYMITLTPNTNDHSKQFNSSTAKEITNYTYDGTEKVLWVDDLENLPDDFKDTDKQVDGQVTVGGEASIPGLNIYRRQAMLVTYYLRTKPTPDALTVHYIDQSNNNYEFYWYDINVNKGTYIPEGINIPETEIDGVTALTNGKVTNIKNKPQYISSILSTMPAIKAEYRYAKYNCVRVERRDNKNVYLYYTFTRNATFVVDFGLPLVIKPGDINAELGNNVDKITSVNAQTSAGTISYDGKNVKFTPKATLTSAASIKITYTGQNLVGDEQKTGSITYTVSVVPASNVLYEENFLTKADGWTLDTTTSLAASTAQETQKAKETKNVFGYDKVYSSVTGELGVWKADGLSATAMTGALTTSFYGNAFDLIGSCGPNTGRVMVMFTKSGETKACKAVIVDTRFSDSTIAENLYQVPWAHVEFKEEASYNVEIYASGSKGTSSAATQSVRAYSYAANNDAFASVLASHGMSMADVEYVNAADTISTASSSIATYAAPATLQPGMHVEIDGFRVYRSTTDSVADNYPVNEKNVTYNNILKVVKDQITAYTENEGNKTVSVEDYEAAGGPQNEIYLGKGQSVTFSVGTKQTAIQVSLRAVSDPAQWATSADGNAVTITSNTEMYYAVTSNASGSVTIANRGTTLLAIGNVKLPDDVSTKSASEMNETAVYESVCAAFATSLPVDPEPDQTVFVPEHFSIRNYATPLFRHKLVTLRIDFSKDVSYVEIDGQKYYPSKFASWFGYYTVTFTDTIGRNDNYFYKVVFFDANGNPSETQSVYGK